MYAVLALPATKIQTDSGYRLRRFRNDSKISFLYVIFATFLFGLHTAYSNTLTTTTNSPNPVPIPDVVVTAPQQINSELTQLANTNMITADVIRQSGAGNIVDLLQDQPGVQIYNTTGNKQQSMISLRGFGENAIQNTLVLIDGRRLVNPDLSPPDLSVVPVSRIQRIEVLPGSAGVLYGDQAVGGVVNIITKQADRFNADVGVQYGSYQMMNAYASVANLFKNGFNFQFDGAKNYSNNYRDHNRLNGHNGAARVGYRYDTGSLFLNYQYSQHDLNLPGALTKKQVDDDRRQTAPYSKQDYSNETINIVSSGFEQWLSPQLKLQADLSHQWMDGDSVLVGTSSNQKRRVLQTNPLLTGHYRFLNKPITVRLGSNITYDDYNFDYVSNPLSNVSDTQTTESAFAQLSLPIWQKLQLITGARSAWLQGDINEQSVSHHVFVSEVGFHYPFTRSVKAYIRRSGNYRFPKADEQNNFIVNAPITPLDPQKGVSYETGIAWKKSTLFGLHASLYQLNLNNEIAYAPPDEDSDGRATNRNLDPTQRRGVLFDGFYQLTDDWRVFADYTYTNGRYSSGPFKGNRIPLVAENLSRVGARYNFLNDWYVTGEAVTTGKTYGSGDDLNQDPIGGYTVYNAVLGYHHHKWQLTGRFNNMTGKKYYNYVVFSSPTSFYYPAPGRNFLLILRYGLI